MMEDCLEVKKMQQFKEAVTEKKRTDSRNEQLVYSRKRAILRVEIRSLTSENMAIEDASQDNSQEALKIQLESLKQVIMHSQNQEETWKALLKFDSIFKSEHSFTVKQQLSTDSELLRSLFQIVKEAPFSDECKLGALQILSEVTESFKRLHEFQVDGETIVFNVYLRILRSAKASRIFSTVLQGMSQLCLDNNKASEFFVKNGLYSDILAIFQNFHEQKADHFQNPECLKDACILIHGLSLSKIQFDYADPRLKLVFEYLMVSSDPDIYYDISTTLLHFTKALANQPNMEWAKDQLDKLYNYGLMKVVTSLIQPENVWVPVRGYNILTNIAYIKSSQIKSDFSRVLHETKTFDTILETLKSLKLQIVLKYHIFMTLKSLVEANCIQKDKLDYLISCITAPNEPINSQIQKLIIETTWEAFEKMTDGIEPTISQDLVRTLCQTLKDENDCIFTMKCLSVLDRIMQVSTNDPLHSKTHTKWLQAYNFNGIINRLQLHQNQEISKKAVQVVSYLDSDEESGSDFYDDEDDENNSSYHENDESENPLSDTKQQIKRMYAEDSSQIVEEH